MSKLNKYYELIQGLKDLGLELKTSDSEQTAIEDDFIKNEIIPAIENVITPIISQVQKRVFLTIDYVPGKVINISMDKINDIKDENIEPSKVINNNSESRKIPFHNKSKANMLRIILPDGRIIQKATGADTLVDVVKFAGVENVKKLGMKLNGLPLVTNIKSSSYNQKVISKGLYLGVQANTMAKKKIIEKISDALNLNMTVEIIEKL